MRIFVLGGDGFCGWPTALKLARDHEVYIFDNLSRRKIDVDLGSNSLTDIATIQKRIEVACDVGYNLSYCNLDLNHHSDIFNMMLEEISPECIVHFAEQRAAPYSMLGPYQREYTVDNNINGTNKVLSAIVSSGLDIHLVHLGTMGVYGYSDKYGTVPEGYIDMISPTGEHVDILYPTDPGSIYHMTKSLDQILFQFYNKNWKLPITDLHQGIVWGIETEDTKRAPELINRFDYDGIYGTVLNRFIMQAAIGHPLSVYGTGGQDRAFIHIEDTTNCIKLAVENPPKDRSRVRIFNQVSEVCNVLELAEMFNTEIEFVPNPRKEKSENRLIVENTGLTSLGFEPTMLQDKLVEDVHTLAEQNATRAKIENILNSPEW